MDIRYDLDPTETQEWTDSLKAVVKYRGPERANFLVERVVQEARREGAYVTHSLNTPYMNTIPPEKEEKSPGTREIEHKIRSAIRWNAVAIILRANKESSELGGHIASFQSSALSAQASLRTGEPLDWIGQGLRSRSERDAAPTSDSGPGRGPSSDLVHDHLQWEKPR